jgi:eukaryotic-like serine/threonine-protein kinase
MPKRGKAWSELELREGEILDGKYRVDAVIGVGGMGVVLRARHLALKDRVALKILQKGASTEASERFFREAQAAARIKSPHVARVLDVGRLPSGSPYIVMEFLDGRDLGRVLADRGPLPVEEAVRYVLETCEALAAAHALGVIHRDVKPSNLFLNRETDGSSTIRVVDFGVSKQTKASEYSSLTGVESAIGTPSYMSPEQVKSSKTVDARSDVWSIGVVLHELLTARLPFDADSLAGLVALLVDPSAVATPVREHRPDLPEEIEQIILRCLTKDPSERFADVSELAYALSPFAGPEGAVSSARTARILTSATPFSEDALDDDSAADPSTLSRTARDTAIAFSSTRWPFVWRGGEALRKYTIPAALVLAAGFGATLYKLGSPTPETGASAASAPTLTATPSVPGSASPFGAEGVLPAEPVQIQDLPVDRESPATPVAAAAAAPRSSAAPSARPAARPSSRPPGSPNEDLSNPYELMVNPYR